MTQDELPLFEQSNSSTSGQNNFANHLDNEIKLAGGEFIPPPEFAGSVGVTMFDSPSSKDNLITVLVSKQNLSALPSQAIVQIGHVKHGDGRVYQGIVVEGPFHEPDGIRSDSSIIVTTAANGVMFMPNYHGRVMIEIIGELSHGQSIPPRYRPLPNSPVFPLDDSAVEAALKVGGNLPLGRIIGMNNIEVKIPSDTKTVLPRHIGILGTTGGGKSTTVSGFVNELQGAGIATILIDTEGEYTQMYKETDDPGMKEALKRINKIPLGVNNVKVLRLVGRETSCDDDSRVTEFSLVFENLAPDLVVEILGLNEAQASRYRKAYEIARKLLARLKIFPSGNSKDEYQQLIDLDELEKSYPKLRIEMMYDIVQACGRKVAKDLKNEDGSPTFKIRTTEFQKNQDVFLKTIEIELKDTSHKESWFRVQGELGKLLRLKIFDHQGSNKLDYNELTKPGTVNILDLGDTDSPQINNLVIAQLLKGTLDKQNQMYKAQREQKVDKISRVMVIIEEAHEFLSRERIKQMPTLEQQVARIARRGRKRWLGLTFVTQLPQHLPDELLSLMNSYVLHKIGDSNVISRLKRSIGGVDESLWKKLPNLAAGQAIVTTPSLSRALLVAINPTPCKLLMIE